MNAPGPVPGALQPNADALFLPSTEGEAGSANPRTLAGTWRMVRQIEAIRNLVVDFENGGAMGCHE